MQSIGIDAKSPICSSKTYQNCKSSWPPKSHFLSQSRQGSVAFLKYKSYISKAKRKPKTWTWYKTSHSQDVYYSKTSEWCVPATVCFEMLLCIHQHCFTGAEGKGLPQQKCLSIHGTLLHCSVASQGLSDTSAHMPHDKFPHSLLQITSSTCHSLNSLASP